MNPVKLYTKHLLVSFIFLFFFVGALFLLSDFIQRILYNPYDVLGIDQSISIRDIYNIIIFSSLTIIIVLSSFIFYLLVTFNSRFKLEIWNTAKTISVSREQFKKIYDHAPMPYIMLDKNAQIHEPNKATLRFFGVTSEEIENKNIFSYISENLKDQKELLFQYYKTGVVIEKKELEMVTKSGDTKSVLLSVFKIKNLLDASQNTGLAMIFDVTEQKLLDKAKTEFLSLASHQLRTPLATTKWYTEMLLSGDMGELSSKQKEYITKLDTVNKEMIDLVGVLLNVSRIEMGTLPINIQLTDVEVLTESVLAEMSPLIEKKKIKIIKEYNDSLKNINSDEKLLRIVIQNIVSNAVKYTPDEGTVSITFQESDKEKKIIISDTGIGIPKEDQSYIFNKLFRAENTRNLSTSQGTGLGLYLIKSIIKSLGGDISFTSEENKGSIFTLKL